MSSNNNQGQRNPNQNPNIHPSQNPSKNPNRDMPGTDKDKSGKGKWNQNINK